MEEFESMPMEDGGLLAAFGFGTFLFVLVIYLFAGFCIGKLFEKAGKPLWTGFVPVYNMIILLEVVGRPAWWIVLLLLPFTAIIALPAVLIDLSRSFGKNGSVWAAAMMYFAVIMIPMMAFSSDIRYVGPAAASEGSGTGL